MWLSSLVCFGIHQSANGFCIRYAYRYTSHGDAETLYLVHSSPKEGRYLTVQACLGTQMEGVIKVLLLCLRSGCSRAIESVWPATLVPEDLHETARL
jgi:hypothetical protein